MQSVIKVMKKTKRAVRYGVAHWPELEDELKDWILNERAEGKKVSTVIIMLKAKEIALRNGIVKLRASDSWCNRFMKRHRLSVRTATSIGQKLPDDWQEKIEKFKLYLNKIKDGIDLVNIGNMDEVPVCFDMPGTHTVDEKGSQDVRITTTGHEKMCFTVVLCVTAKGSKCTPMVIFKRKTMPEDKFPCGIIVKVNERRWMNAEVFKEWIKEVWNNRKGRFFKKSDSVLIYDSARSHFTEEVKAVVNKHARIAMIPDGMTKLLQPLDISVNKSFKSRIRLNWECG